MGKSLISEIYNAGFGICSINIIFLVIIYNAVPCFTGTKLHSLMLFRISREGLSQISTATVNYCKEKYFIMHMFVTI